MWWHTVTHGMGSEGETGEWSGYSVPFSLPRNMVYPTLLPLMCTPRLPVVDWTEAPADLNGLVPFAERRKIWFLSVCHHILTGLCKLHYKYESNWNVFLHINPLSPELNPICYLLALLWAHHFLHVSRIRVKSLTFRRLMSHIYGAPILDVSRSHTTTHHSR